MIRPNYFFCRLLALVNVCAAKTRHLGLKQKEERDDLMPSVDIDDLLPKQLRNVQFIHRIKKVSICANILFLTPGKM